MGIVRVVNYCYNLGLDAPNEAFAHLAAFFSGQGGQALEHKPPQTSTNLSQLPTHCKGISNFVVDSSFQSWSVVSVLLWYRIENLKFTYFEFAIARSRTGGWSVRS